MISLQLRAQVGGAGKGVVLAPLRDGGPGGVTFSHLPGKISERNSTKEGTRTAVTKGGKHLPRSFNQLQRVQQIQTSVDPSILI
jgi:hypothetical protein